MRHILALSGGKDSTALAVHMLNTQPDLPMEYCFADTGRELPDVYKFLDDLEGLIGRPITRLSDYGRDFDYYLDRWNWFLPGNASRWCTKHLKLRPFERLVRGSESTIYIGIRADENRVGNYGTPGVTYKYPFVDDGIDLEGVMQILGDARIEMPKYYEWRSTGGCWMCPWQRPKDWVGLKANHPDLFAQAVEEEKKATESSGKPCTWSVRRIPLEQLIVHIESQPSLFPENDWKRDDIFADDRPCLICAK